MIVNNRKKEKTNQFLKLIPKQSNNITTIHHNPAHQPGSRKNNVDIQNVKIGVKVGHANTVVKPLQQLQRLEPQQIHQIITTPQQTILQQAVPTSVMSTTQKPVILIAKKGMVSDQYFIPLASNGNVQNVQKIQMQGQQIITGQVQQQQRQTINKQTVQQQPVIQHHVQRVTQQNVKCVQAHKPIVSSNSISSSKNSNFKKSDSTSKIVFCKF